MKQQRLVMSFLVLLLIGTGGGCSRVSLDVPELSPVRDGNVTLYVSNQSFADDTVDIKVLIDGKVVVHDNFEVKNQHAWHTFTFQLEPGKHTLQAHARSDSVVLKTDFELPVEKRWAVLNYWYNPTTKGGVDLTPRQMKFGIHEEQPGFM